MFLKTAILKVNSSQEGQHSRLTVVQKTELSTSNHASPQTADATDCTEKKKKKEIPCALKMKAY
jgi:hypothetical protein